MYGDYIMLPAWMRGAVSDQERSCVTTVQNAFNEITKCDIEVAFRAIRVHVRRTPVIEICGSELGLQKFRLTLKLESMQYAGSFKTRGAMTNLLLRDIPPAGVTAASGGNHGAVEIMKLVVNAYPDSADAYGNLSDAYLADGEKDLARQTAEKALALLDSHAVPASSWSDTEERRKLIRDGAQDNLKQLGVAR
jgi:Pyridoxal-phosphate dependent enzyme